MSRGPWVEWRQVACMGARSLARAEIDAIDDGWTVGATRQRGSVFVTYMSRRPLATWDLAELDMLSDEHRAELGRRLLATTSNDEIEAIAERLRSDHELV